MISFALRCRPHDHGFDGWFRSGADFERQRDLGLVECPQCGSTAVDKALMAPAVSPAREAATARTDAAVVAKLQAMAREVRARAEYVGPRFAEEARRIHYGEADSRGIYGEASPPEVRGLAEEGIAALPLPPLPEDKN